MAVPVDQTTERTDFEDGTNIGNQSVARNCFQRVRTILRISVTIDPALGMDRVPPGMTKFHNSANYGVVVLM